MAQPYFDVGPTHRVCWDVISEFCAQFLRAFGTQSISDAETWNYMFFSDQFEDALRIGLKKTHFTQLKMHATNATSLLDVSNNVGPTSQTVIQHLINIGEISRVSGIQPRVHVDLRFHSALYYRHQ